MYHYIKYFIIKLIYSAISVFNIKKKFFRNDFESKIYSYYKKNVFDDTYIKKLEKNFPKISEELRISDELKISNNHQNWYKNDDLFQLSLKYRPTKRRHDYFKHYHSNFSSIRNDVKKILEIGVDKGESLNLWKEYFSNATIYGIDVINFQEINDERIKLFKNNAYDINFINSLPNNFDLIIDDGPHTLDSMVSFLQYYQSKLNDHGILIIEDIQDINWIEILKSHILPENIENYTVHDLRAVKGRYDDILLIIDKSRKA